MSEINEPDCHRGVAQKTDAVLAAIRSGHSRIAAIAEATRLHETTVIRVARLLFDRGQIGIARAEGFELRPEA
jgi:hypothetical protein